MSKQREHDREGLSVAFDMDVRILWTCPLDYHVSDTYTTININEVGTSMILDVDDEPLLTLADTAAQAVTAMLLDRRVPDSRVDGRSIDGPEDCDTPRRPISTHTAVTIKAPCPMSFISDTNGDGARIVIRHPDTLCLTFDDRSLLEFALLTSKAARTVSTRLDVTPGVKKQASA